MPIGFSTIVSALPVAFPWTEVGLTMVIMAWAGWQVLRRRAAVRQVAKRALIGLLVMQLLVYITEYAWLMNKFRLDPILKHLMPPESLYFYHLMIRSLLNLLIAWGLAAAVTGLIYFGIMKRGQVQFLDHQDLFLLTMGVAAVGWPAGLIFLALTFAYTVIGMIGLVILRKRTLNDRLVISPFILPAALTTILLKGYLLELTHLKGIQI